MGRATQGAIWRRTAAGAVFASGLLTLISALTPNVPWRDDLLLTVEPGSLMSLGHVLTGAAALVLMALARSMAAGTRRAVTVAAVLLAFVAVLDIAKGLDYEESAVAVALAALLVAGRGSFTRGATSRPGLVAGVVAVGSIAALYALSIVPLLVAGDGNGLRPTLEGAAGSLYSGSWWLRSGHPLAVALDVALAVGLAGAIAFVQALLRPEPSSDGHRPGEHERAADLVRAHGADSLDPFLLREDKAFFFARGGVAGYRVLRETAVVSGDPVAPDGCAGTLLADFLDFAHARGWRVAVAGASGRRLADWRGLGLRTMCVGEEAVVDPTGFSLQGRRIRKVRQSVTRARRRGWSTEVHRAADIDARTWLDITALEEEWRGSQRRLHGFAMTLGRLGGAREDAEMLYVLARGPDGGAGALLRLVPYAGGLSLDAMRRGAEAPNGLTEVMVVQALEHARELGCSEVSLNFAGFGHVMSPDRALTSRRQRLLRLALGALHGRFQLERLSAFNQKFDPAWRPRYIVYDGRGQLPRAALRVLQAEAYIRPPRTRALEERWRAPAWAPEPEVIAR